MHQAKEFVESAFIFFISLFSAGVTLLNILYRRIKLGSDLWHVKERNLPPPCLQDTSYGTHAYLKLHDIKLHYVESGDRNKPLMLFVHGFPEFWFAWRYQLKHFAKTHWVVAMDMRGYGDSDKPTKISDYRFDLLEKDIYNFIKGLKRDKCILVAHDWGAAISWIVATKYPEIIHKLIIINGPHPTAFVSKVQTSLTQFVKSWYIFLFQIPHVPELFFYSDDLSIFSELFKNAEKKCTVSDEDLEGYKYTYSRKGAWTPPINYYRNDLEFRRRFKGKSLPKIKVPTEQLYSKAREKSS